MPSIAPGPRVPGTCKPILLLATCAMASSAALAQTCEDVASGDRIRSLVVTAQDDVFDHADFSFGRTLGQIIATAGAVDTPAERIAMVQSLVRSFNASAFENPASGIIVPVEVRPEADLDPLALLDPANPQEGMHPVGLFNRFDLADAAFAGCGEHRIVYALGDGQPVDHRMTLIFEAEVPNPAPGLGEAGCLPIVRFWQDLANVSDPAELAARLDAFYFAGLDVDQDGAADLAPVVHADHFGLRGGQVRGNMFVVDGDFSFAWQLREWLVGRNVDTSPTFTVETIKDTPQEEFYGDIDDPLTDFADFQRRFQQEFVSLNLINLMRPEIDAKINGTPLSPTGIITGFSAGFANQYNDFQSISGDPGGNSPDEPRTRLDTSGNKDFKPRIEDQLLIFDLPGAPTVTHIANRAGAMSCGGCHQFSNNEPIAPPLPGGTEELRWPTSMTPPGFVHIDEQGDLSPALREHFLVARCERIEGFIAEHEADPEVTAEALVAGIKGAMPELALGQTVKDVLEAQQSFMAAQTPEQRSIALGNLEAAVKIDRRRREQTPGAFYEVRRTH